MSTPPQDREWIDVGELLEDPKLPPPKTGRPAKWGEWKAKPPEQAIGSSPPPLRKESEADPPPVRSLWVRDPEDSRPKLRALTPEEIRADTLPDPLVERLVYEGILTSYVGLNKQGKSYSAAQMALCVAAGEPFLGLQTVRSRVLYVSWEVTAKGMLSRMENIAEDAGLSDPNPLFDDHWLLFYGNQLKASAPRFNLSLREDWSLYYEFITTASPELVFIDTLRKTTQGVEYKDDIAWSEVIDRFNLICRETGIAHLVIDHGSRDREEASAASFAMGSQVKGAETPCVAKLTRRRKDGEPDRWRIDVDSWFDDPGTPIWYQRPQGPGEEPGCGCELCDAPEPERPGPRSGPTSTEMKEWLRERIPKGAAVAAAAIGEEAAVRWPDLTATARLKSLQRALAKVAGRSEPLDGSYPTQWMWVR